MVGSILPTASISTDSGVSFESDETPSEAPMTFPEGGWDGWLAALGVWLVQFSTFGYTNAYGVYNDFYVREFMGGRFSSFQLSWVGSTQLMLTLSMGLLTGRAFDVGYFYHLMIGGSALFVFCIFMLSFVQPGQLYQVFLAQGLGQGIAIGITYVPGIALLSHYFSKRRAFVMGLSTSGSGVGGAVQAIMLNKLIHGGMGFRASVRISAAFNMGILMIAILMMRTRLPPSPMARKGNTRSDLKRFFKDPPYFLTVVGTVFVLSGLYFPFFFMQLNSITNGMDRELAFYVITVMNGASVVGRLVATAAISSVGVFNIVIPSVFSCSVLIFSTLGVKAIASTMIFAILYGFFSGAYVGSLAPMVASLSLADSEIGARMGICFAFTGFGGLIGSPIAGALLSSSFRWWRPILFAGLTVMCGSCFFTVSRFLLTKRNRTQKV